MYVRSAPCDGGVIQAESGGGCSSPAGGHPPAEGTGAAGPWSALPCRTGGAPWGVWGGASFDRGRGIPRKRPRGRPRKADLERDRAYALAAGC